MPLIAITEVGQLDPAEAVAAFEEAGHEVRLLCTTEPDEIVARAGDCEALYVAVARIGADTIARLPHLRVIATASVGYNHIDVAAAHARGIIVCNIPSVASEEVATHALAGMLMMLREVEASVAEVRDGGWRYSTLPLPPRISDLTLGLVSLGRIARHFAERTLPLVGRVVAFDPFIPDEAWMPGVERMDSFEELCAVSNVLSLHAPATAETRGIVNADALTRMPAGGYLVNVARGELVDTDALLTALDSGRLRGAFLDVLELEPPIPGSALISHPRVWVTPHSGFRSEVSVREYLMIPVRNILSVLSGYPAPNQVGA